MGPLLALLPEIAVGAELIEGAADVAALTAPTLSAAIPFGGSLGILTAIPAGGTILSLGASIALSYGASLLTKPPDLPGIDRQTTIKQATPARFVVLGRAKIAGVMFFYDPYPVVGSSRLWVGKILASHRINAIEQPCWLFDYPISLSGGTTGSPTGSMPQAGWATHILVSVGLGATDQVADASLVAQWNAQGIWTSAHRLRGLAYVVINYLDAKVTDGSFAKIFPNGAPEYKAVIQGRLVFDPRDGTQNINDETTWKYSDNAALIVAWYIMHADGWGLGSTVIDLDNLIEEANACDELVARPDGLSEKRYRIWGEYSLNEPRKTILAELLLACAGRISIDDVGKIKITVGRSIAATITIGDDLILSLENFLDGPDPTERVGTVNPRIIYEPANWQTIDCPTNSAIVYNSDDRFGDNTLDLTLRFCPSPYQAQRIAKKVIDEKNSGWRGTLRCNLGALADASGNSLLDAWTVNVSISELGISSLFEVLSVSLDTASMTLLVGVREMTETVWDWGAASGTAVILPLASTNAWSTIIDDDSNPILDDASNPLVNELAA